MIAESKSEIIALRQSQMSSISTDHTLKSITLNPTEICNRKCGFCPRSEGYPNQNFHISRSTVERLSQQLFEFNFTGRLGWSGNGEPLLTRNLYDSIKIISKIGRAHV